MAPLSMKQRSQIAFVFKLSKTLEILSKNSGICILLVVDGT